jgi:hypothetical protein
MPKEGIFVKVLTGGIVKIDDPITLLECRNNHES